ncbi:MAG: hypothetical protein IJT32_01070 [Lachnospiraceae bacterium]|nr:hypothetical protein [Lachnospiraceae bacterium]
MANYLPFNSILDGEGTPDRPCKAEDWAWYFSTFIGNGVFPKPTDGLQVVSDSDMNVLVKDGFGYINGYAFKNPADYQVTITTADGSLPRIDRIVLRWDLANRLMQIALLTGTPSASPSAPPLARTADRYELALADIAVAAGTTTITQSMITDRRSNTDLCGIVEGTVSQIDWAALTSQLNAFMDEYSAAIVSDYAGYTAQIEEFETQYESDIQDWTEDQQAAFLAWVATIQDILDETVAGQLELEIERLRNQVGIPDAYDSDTVYDEGDYCIEDNTLQRAKKQTLGGGFDSTFWEPTTVLSEIQKRIDIEREKIYTKIANNQLAIESRLVINDSGDHLLLDDLGTILAVNQTVKFNFA